MRARSSGVRLVDALACSWDYQKGLFSVFTLTIMQLVYPPKFCISIVSDFLLDVIVIPTQLEDNGKILGVHKVHYSQCENAE